MVISVYLPSNLEASSTLDVYVNGIRDDLESIVLTHGLEVVNIPIKDTMGYTHVELKINNVIYKEYDIDFDRRIINEL